MVRGAIGLARRMGISPLIIGLSVIAMGTSAPEFVTTLTATLEEAPDLALGNVVGSNLANMLLILGVAGLLKPLVCERKMIARDGTMVMGATALFVAIAFSGCFLLWHGVILLTGLFGYLYLTYRAAASDADSGQHSHEGEDITAAPERLWLGVFYVFGGVIGTVIGAKLLVDGGVTVADSLGISKAIIGLTLVAIGTSLPELAIVVVASIRGHNDVALGNVLGSNIFNLLGITGAVAIVAPLPVPEILLSYDIWVLLGITVLLMPLMLATGGLSRFGGSLLVFLYAVYMIFQLDGMRAMIG